MNQPKSWFAITGNWKEQKKDEIHYSGPTDNQGLPAFGLILNDGSIIERERDSYEKL